MNDIGQKKSYMNDKPQQNHAGLLKVEPFKS